MLRIIATRVFNFVFGNQSKSEIQEEAPEFVEKVLQIPLSTLCMMEELADIAGFGSIDLLLQDVLRQYEKIIYHESCGERLCVIDSETTVAVESLPRFIKPGKEVAAQKYFEGRNFGDKKNT